MSTKWRKRLEKLWREVVRPFLVILVVLGSFRSAVADWNDVPTGSMKPTILEGDRIFVNKLAYDLKLPFTRWHLFEWAEPERSDVIIFFSPADARRMVKRVVGLPGDRIELLNNRLIINDVPATYDRLDEVTIEQIDAAQRSRHRFAGEKLGDRRHPVMTTFGIPAGRSFPAVIVPEGHYFVLGDNRDNSADSRSFGFVPRKQIVGEATAIAFSFDRDDYYKPRWHRFFKDLP